MVDKKDVSLWSVREMQLLNEAFGCRLSQMDRRIRTESNPEIGGILQQERQEISDLLYRITNLVK